MEIKFEFIDKTLYFPKDKILVIADLHIGYEESLNEKGIFIPRSQFKETVKDLKKILRKIKSKKLKKIIILGDLKHEFGKISRQEWREVGKILDIFKDKSEKIVLVKGNHDTILEPIAERKDVEIKNYYVFKEFCFLHGHKLFENCLNKKIKIIILGHRHPAVMLSDKYKREKYKCFLVGKWKNKKIIILPSFFPIIEGSDIVNYGENKLFIKEKCLKNFEVFIPISEKEVYRFGKLKTII